MELIKIYKGNLVNARELHGFLEVKTEFSHWIKRMLAYDFEEKTDYVTSVKKDGRQLLKEYHLTISASKEICMLQRSEKGKEARKYFIAAEEKLNQIRQNKRLETFLKLDDSKGKLKEFMLSKDLSMEDFIQVDEAGKKVLFNGQVVEDEELNTMMLAGRDFATQVALYKSKENDLAKIEEIKEQNKISHGDVRDTLLNRGIKPEELPREKSVKKYID